MGDMSTWAANYGPGFLALMLMLQFFQNLLPKLMGNKRDDAHRELARSVEKLAVVLDRMERDQERELSEVRDTLRETLAIVQRMDIGVADIKAKVALSGPGPQRPN